MLSMIGVFDLLYICFPTCCTTNSHDIEPMGSDPKRLTHLLPFITPVQSVVCLISAPVVRDSSFTGHVSVLRFLLSSTFTRLIFPTAVSIRIIFTHLLLRARRGAKYEYHYVWLSVCPSVRLHDSKTTRPNSTKIFMRVVYGRGSILLWQRCDTLCTSGFVDDVIFSHNGLMTPTSITTEIPTKFC